jgi:hypothetical protein
VFWSWSETSSVEIRATKVQSNLTVKGANAMASVRQQGAYLGSTLAGFTAFVAGLYNGGGMGKLVTLVGAALLVFAAAGFYRLKSAS